MMKQIRSLELSVFSLLAVMLSIIGVQEAPGATGGAKRVHVANNGVDSPACGEKDGPCRSISQAIANASAGDEIEVGPGRYGDLNGNGTFGETGEEGAQVGFGCFCMINVNKHVKLVSRDGAFTTVVDAGGAAVLAVAISASDVVFGQPKQGFFVTGAADGFNGLGMLGEQSGVTVAGNVASVNGGSGFGIGGSANRVTDNLATRNGSAGFAIFGSGHVVRDNVASGNGSGFGIFGAGHELRDNVASANGSDGFSIQGTEHELRRNAALGNKGFGINIDPAGGNATITETNIYGNNSVPSGGLVNCGLRNASGGAITATKNFWGEASGPGPDPADAVCDVGSSTTIFVPFATKEFEVQETPLK